MSQHMSKHMSQHMSKHMSKNMSKNMSKHMSKNMSKHIWHNTGRSYAPRHRVVRGSQSTTTRSARRHGAQPQGGGRGLFLRGCLRGAEVQGWRKVGAIPVLNPTRPN